MERSYTKTFIGKSKIKIYAHCDYRSSNQNMHQRTERKKYLCNRLWEGFFPLFFVPLVSNMLLLLLLMKEKYRAI